MDTIKTIDLGDGATFEVIRDECPTSPRDDDNVSILWGCHKRYKIGDENPYPVTKFNGFNAFKSQIETDHDVLAILPVYMYDHSGVAYSTDRSYPFNDQWDAGQVGWIFATAETVKMIFGDTEVTQDRLVDILKSDLAAYEQWTNGNVYGFVLKTPPEDVCKHCGRFDEADMVEDFCWGFYGSDPEENGMLDNIDEKYHDKIKIA